MYISPQVLRIMLALYLRLVKDLLIIEQIGISPQVQSA